MNQIPAVFAFALLASVTLTGQQPASPAAFTAVQAKAGRVAYENGCGRCRTYSLLGRKGDPGELPRADSLPRAAKNSSATRTTSRRSSAKRSSANGAREPSPKSSTISSEPSKTPIFELNMDEATVVNITACILQMNGAKPGDRPLTASTSAVVNSLVE